MCAIATVNEKEPVLGTQTLKVIHYLLYQVKCTTFSTISKGGNFTMLTKSELINDIAYEMSGYLTSEGIDRLKTVITFKLVNINLTAAETLPSTEIFDNEYIMKRYIIDLTATGRKQSTIKLYITIIKKFFAETGLNYHTCTGQDVMDYIATRLHKDKISKALFTICTLTC